MRKRTCVLLALMLLLASIFGTVSSFAADTYSCYIKFYMSLMDSEINAVTTQFNPEYAVRFYSSNTHPDFLDDDPFEYELTDEQGAVLIPDADGTWTLGKGNYKLRWTNMNEVKERLKEWELYDQCRFTFPEEDELTVNISVDGEKSKLTFYIRPSTTLTIDRECEYIFDPDRLYLISLMGFQNDGDYYKLPEFLRTNPQYTFDVKVKRGPVLTEEELTSPLKEGSYFVTWNNVDEIKQLIEESDAEIFDRYTVEFPEEPLTSKFYLKYKDSPAVPRNIMEMYSGYAVEKGLALPDAEHILYVTGKNGFDEDDAEWLSNVQLEYYDMNGRKLDDSEVNGNLALGKYIARWVNFDEFLAMDIEKGWGLQNKYRICQDLDEGDPECICEVYEPEEYYFGSVFGRGTLTTVLGCSTVVCLGVIAVLAVKLKKIKEQQ